MPLVDILNLFKDSVMTLPDTQNQSDIYAHNTILYHNNVVLYVRAKHMVYVGEYNIIPDLLHKF